MRVHQPTLAGLDYPHCRKCASCPWCGRHKERGLLVCWPCYGRLDLRNGMSKHVRMNLDQYEADLQRADALSHGVAL